MKRKCFVVFRHFHKNFSEIFRIFSRSAGIAFLSLPFCIRACRKVPVCRSAEKCGFLRLLCEFSLIPMQNMIYLGCILPTPNAPGQRAFSRCAAPFFLEIRQYSCVKLTKQLLDRALFAELAASLVFSLGVGYAYQRTGLLAFSMAAHGAERLLSNALARGK